MSFLRRAGRTSVRTFAVAALATAVLTVGSQAAFADSTVNVNKSGQGVTAAQANYDCSADFGGGPYVGYDVWVFNLPKHDTSGDFVSVTAHFDTDGDHTADTTKKITADQPSGIVLKGTSKAWIKLPAGWELENASAVITGTADFFTLTHACPAGSPSPSGSSSGSPSTPPSGPAGSPSGSPAPSSSMSGSTTSAPSGSPSSPNLPTTGSHLTGVLILGVLLVGVGAATVFVARRRRPAA